MKKYHVINDFIDKETGQLVKAGDIFPADDDRAQLMREKQLIGKEADKQPDSKTKGKSAAKADEQASQPGDERDNDGDH